MSVETYNRVSVSEFWSNSFNGILSLSFRYIHKTLSTLIYFHWNKTWKNSDQINSVPIGVNYFQMSSWSIHPLCAYNHGDIIMLSPAATARHHTGWGSLRQMRAWKGWVTSLISLPMPFHIPLPALTYFYGSLFPSPIPHHLLTPPSPAPSPFSHTFLEYHELVQISHAGGFNLW